jgi:hypothetical protein
MTPAQTSVLHSALHSSAITKQCCRPVEVVQHQQVPMPGHVRFTQNLETTSSLLLVPPPTLLFRSSVRVCLVTAVLFLGVLSTSPTSRPSPPAAYKYRMVMCQKRKKYLRGNNVFINTSEDAYNLEREIACVPFSIVAKSTTNSCTSMFKRFQHSDACMFCERI